MSSLSGFRRCFIKVQAEMASKLDYSLTVSEIFSTDKKLPPLPRKINTTMESPPFEDVSPIKHGDFPMSWSFQGSTLDGQVDMIFSPLELPLLKICQGWLILPFVELAENNAKTRKEDFSKKLESVLSFTIDQVGRWMDSFC